MRKGLLTILFLAFCWAIFAQQVPITSQYLMNRLVINPAYAGALDFYSASISYRKQWVGLDGSPSTQNFTLHGPALKGKLGLGLVASRDVIGVTKENNISASFAYKIKTKKKQVLSFGIGASAVFINNNWAEINTTNKNDEAFAANSPTYIYPDFSAGIFYKTPKYYVGFSVPMFLDHSLSTSSSEVKISNNFSNYNYLFEGGINFKITDKIELKPSFMSRYLPNSAYQLDINLLADVNNKIAFGLSYRTQDAIVGIVQFHISDQIILGYSFDQSISKLQKYNNGSHEIYLRYDFKYKVKAFDPRFF